MKNCFFVVTALLLTFTAQASTKIYFDKKGEFVVNGSDGMREITTQNYAIEAVESWIHSETSSEFKASDAWKNCYESKVEKVEFPIPWKQAYYTPFMDVYKVTFPISIDNINKTITVDDAQMYNLISQSIRSMNQKTNGKCKIKSSIQARVHAIAADGTKSDFDIAFAFKNDDLFVQYTVTKYEDAYNIDQTKKAVIGAPNENTPIPVFGYMW